MSNYDNELLWWVRYAMRRDLAEHPRGDVPLYHAFFYACTEVEVRRKVANWQRWSKFGGFDVEAIEQVPHGFHLHFRNELPPVQPTRPPHPSDPLYDALRAQMAENERSVRL